MPYEGETQTPARRAKFKEVSGCTYTNKMSNCIFMVNGVTAPTVHPIVAWGNAPGKKTNSVKAEGLVQR